MSWRNWIGRRTHDAHDSEDANADEATREILAEARSLSREAEPLRDLWPGIARRIEQRDELTAPARPGRLTSIPGFGPVPGWAAATAVALTLVVATAWFTLRIAGPAPLDEERIRRIADAARERDGVMDVRESLLGILEERRAEIPPDALAAIEENLRTIDRAIADIQLALEQHPGSSSLNLLLAEAYRREVELLDQLEWWRSAPEETRS